MKLFRLPVVLLCILFACDDSENFPDEPFIEFKTISFSEDKFLQKIVISFSYQDGNGDIGRTLGSYNAPYHMHNAFIIAEGVVTKYPLEPEPGEQSRFSLIGNPLAAVQQVLTKRFMANNNVPGYPTYSDDSACDYYFAAEIKPANAAMMPFSEETSDGYYYDTLLIERNENFYNLMVDFFVQEEDGSFEKFAIPEDRLAVCTFPSFFYMILPVITGNRDYESLQIRGNRNSGKITFDVRSLQFKNWFQNKKVKLQIQIIDNALHRSNIIETDVLQF
jgi:hypothetical protein